MGSKPKSTLEKGKLCPITMFLTTLALIGSAFLMVDAVFLRKNYPSMIFAGVLLTANLTMLILQLTETV